MYIFLKLGLLCSHPDPSFRPSMGQVVQVMAGDADVPDVRRSMPEASLASDLPHLSIAELLHSRSGSQNSKLSEKRPEPSASVPSSTSYCELRSSEFAIVSKVMLMVPYGCKLECFPCSQI